MVKQGNENRNSQKYTGQLLPKSTALTATTRYLPLALAIVKYQGRKRSK